MEFDAIAVSKMRDRHQCHCGKSFLRKEHLKRHQAVHNGRSHVCHICQRTFTRNDLLRRHVALHTATPVPTTRTGRACDACHENKTRCDGGDQCSLCMKRGIACTFDRPPPGTKDGKTAANGLEVGPSVDAEMAEGIAVGQGEERNLELDACCARTCLKSIMKAVSVPAFKGVVCEDPPSSGELRAWIEACIGHYAGTFHERWTIVHMPSFDEKTEDAFKVGAVLLIGAWLRDRENLGDIILDIHNRLLHRLLSLIMAPSQSSADKPWPVDKYQASLLQVIFAFETGMPKLIQRARRLLSVLITAMRDQGAFNPHVVKHHGDTHFPGDFKPWVHTQKETYRLLAYNIFKVDVGISLFLNQPPLLTPEELELSVPSTWALNNAYGIDVFFERHPLEPVDREQTPMLEIATNPLGTIASGFLFQDIQLGLLGLYGEIYRWVQVRRVRDTGMTANCCRDLELQAQLQSWNSRLEQICGLWRDPIVNSEHINYVMSAHMGNESPREDGWETPVSKRISRAFFNVSMLHGLLRLYLLMDTRHILSFSTESWNMAQTIAQPTSDPDMTTRLQHWAASWKGRRAVIQSLQILKLYEKAPFMGPEDTMDPFAHMAAATAALTLRCWIKNSTELCQCGVVPGHPTTALRLEMEADKELWADEGGIAVLEGMPMCVCSLSVWESRFVVAMDRSAKDWEMRKAVLQKLSPNK